jgi:photosystem II stability/assembly factor-like uncharacterized protein
MNGRILLIGVLACATFRAPAQTLHILSDSLSCSIRGLSVVSDRVIWVSGSQGMIGRSIDSGKTWRWTRVKHFEQRDFRDVEAFDENKAVIMAIAEPACLLMTLDGGRSWNPVFLDSAKGMFLDAMEFWNTESGIVLGDPIDGRFYIARSFDGGLHWHPIPREERPESEPGEACFAASGTNLRKLNRQEACFVSGGSRSRLFIRDQQLNLPILQGSESTGANSIAIEDDRSLHGGDRMIVVGGDFSRDSLRDRNCFLSKDRGKTWVAPATGPHGYRSCVEWIGEHRAICCGTNGVDISPDGGLNWRLISGLGFHVCRRAKQGRSVFLAGPRGRIARLEW